MRGIRAVCAISVVVLAACSSPAEPQTLEPLPSSTSDSVPSQQPTPSQPDESPSASPNEVIDFVDEYFDAVEGSIRSQAALVNRRASFASSCTVCSSGADVAEQILSTGYQVSGGLVEHTTQQVEDIADGALVQVRYRVSELTLTDSAGEVVSSAPTTDWTTQVLDIRKQPDGSWLIISAEQLP